MSLIKINKFSNIITKPLYGNGGEGIHRFDQNFIEFVWDFN